MIQLEIRKEFPPNIKDIEKVFNLKDKKPIFAWNPIIYAPYGGDIDEPLRVHELTHFNQQGDYPELWWKYYIEDPKFRLEAEIEAYHNQYQALKKIVKDKNKQALYLRMICLDLSSEMYDKICTYDEAVKAVKYYKNK